MPPASSRVALAHLHEQRLPGQLAGWLAAKVAVVAAATAGQAFGQWKHDHCQSSQHGVEPDPYLEWGTLVGAGARN